MKRKLLSLFLVAVMVFSVLPVSADAAKSSSSIQQELNTLKDQNKEIQAQIIENLMPLLRKRTVILVTHNREEAALADAIEAGQLGGLGVDVYSAEPLPAEHAYSRIMEKPNVIFTPHCAWGAQEARNRCVREVAENILAFSRGERRNRVC